MQPQPEWPGLSYPNSVEIHKTPKQNARRLLEVAPSSSVPQ